MILYIDFTNCTTRLRLSFSILSNSTKYREIKHIIQTDCIYRRDIFMSHISYVCFTRFLFRSFSVSDWFRVNVNLFSIVHCWWCDCWYITCNDIPNETKRKSKTDTQRKKEIKKKNGEPYWMKKIWFNVLFARIREKMCLLHRIISKSRVNHIQI